MNDPGYDFFAIGGPNDPATAQPQPPAGQPPIIPAPVPPVVGATYHSPEPARTFQMGNTTVNQFGTPVDLPAVPTGPYAAPGMGAAPTPVPGLVTTWEGPQGPGRQAPAGHRTAAASRDELPPNVRAVAILALFVGVLDAILTVLAWNQYSQLTELVDQAGGAGSPNVVFARELLTVMLVSIVLLALLAIFVLVGGGATLAKKRWGGWMLVAAFGFFLFNQIWTILHGQWMGLWSMFWLAVGAALLGALVTGDGRRWLMNQS